MPATRNEQELPSTIQRSDDKAKRTTRALALTDAGEAVYRHARLVRVGA